jgi:hypothetical protein
MTLTDDIISFIEEVMMKYGLEDELIKGDSPLEKELSEVKNLYERFAIKFVFGQKIKQLRESGKSLEDILPSMKLKRILEKLINKKISFDDLPELIKNDLHTNQEVAEDISKSIEKNKEIVEILNGLTLNEDVEENDEIEELDKKVDSENKKSIGGELLK